MTDRWRLINGKELYDMSSDPGQKKDVAAKHPAVVTELRDGYEKWYADICKRFDEYCDIPLGVEKQGPVQLCCHDWHGEIAPAYQERLLARVKANGFWAVEVARAGKYAITLRERPAVAKYPLKAVKARLSVGKQEWNKPVAEGVTAVTFEVSLKPGKTRLQSWLTEKDGTSRGAYYVEVKFLE
jgi:hypothetical protein